MQNSKSAGKKQFKKIHCLYFNNGYCRYGERCRYAHVEHPAAAPRRIIHQRAELINSRLNRWILPSAGAQANSVKTDDMEDSYRQLYLSGQAKRSLRPCYHFNTGNCRNGERCEFAHVPYPANAPRRFINPRSATHIDRRPNRNSQWLSPKLTESVNRIDLAINNLRDAAKDFVNSNSWLLTCVGIQGCPGNIDGFLNISPEEARFLYNEAKQNNALNEYVIQLNDSKKTAKWCFDQIAEMNDEARGKVAAWMEEQEKKFERNQSQMSAYSARAQNDNDTNEYERDSFFYRVPHSPPKKCQCDP